METINQTIDQVRNRLADLTGKPSAGNSYSRRTIYKYVNDARLKLVREKRLQASLQMHDWYFSNLCVDLTRASLVDCDGIPPEGFFLLKSKLPLPKAMRGKPELVMSAGGTVFTRVDISDLLVKAEDRLPVYNDRNLYALRSTDTEVYLLLKSDKHLKTVMVKQMLDDITDLHKFNGCNKKETKCMYFPDLPFQIDGDLKQACIAMATEALLRSIPRVGPDIKGDDVDNTVSQASIK